MDYYFKICLSWWPSSEVIYLLGMRDCDTIPQMSFTLLQNQYFKICLSIVTEGRIQHIKSYATIVEVHMIVLHETSGVYGNSIPVVYLYEIQNKKQYKNWFRIHQHSQKIKQSMGIFRQNRIGNIGRLLLLAAFIPLPILQLYQFFKIVNGLVYSMKDHLLDLPSTKSLPEFLSEFKAFM